MWGALVPSPRGGLGALWQRFTRTMQRSGRTVALLLLVTNALPQFVGAVVMELLGARASVVTDPLSRSDRELVAIGGGLALLMLAWGLVTIWLAAWGSACCS